ncbi:MAG: DNA replication and repair protein RecF [Patescibacteria group bacterium]
MDVTALRLEHFRNQPDRKLTLAPKTIITGDNGSGKTSVLEAIRVVSVGKSFRTSKIEDLTEFDQPYLRVSLTAKSKKYEFFYGNQFSEDPSVERRLTVGGKPITYMEFLGMLPSVSFVPKDVDIITEQPSLRRQFIDGILWQSDPEFRRNQIDYNQVLRERSQLLFFLKINRASIDELQPWDELLLNLAQKIRRAREEFVKFATATIKELSDTLPGKIAVELSMEVSADTMADLQQQEIRLGHNLFGPHRDDLKILTNDRLARRFASRGQARSTIALLKAIEAKYLERQIETTPIILLDDLVSELDEENVDWLFSIYGDKFQLIATSVKKLNAFKGWEELKI